MGETTKFPVGSITNSFYLQTLEHPDIIRHFANCHLSDLKKSKQNKALSKALTGFFGLDYMYFQKKVGEERLPPTLKDLESSAWRKGHSGRTLMLSTTL